MDGMARSQPTLARSSGAVRRADRAKRARDTISKVIPELLRTSPRARHGIHKALLMVDPDETATILTATSRLSIRLQSTDALTAARRLTSYSRRASISASSQAKVYANGRSYPNVCVLNMASATRPGGGFADGMTSQEEFLCSRSTLFPSLWEDFYRLPDVGGVYTPDVLVFRDSTLEADDLVKRDRFFIDVISAAMIKYPPNAHARDPEDDRGPCSCGISYCDRERDLIARKMRAVLRMAQSQGAEKLVLGAWGCGALGNPVREVAKMWKKVLLGTHRKQESWPGIKEVVFAIDDRLMLREFERCFADVLASSQESISPPSEFAGIAGSSPPKNHASAIMEDLLVQIQEIEVQLSHTTNARSKAQLRNMLANLNQRLTHVGAVTATLDDLPSEDDEEEEGFVMAGFPTADPSESSSYYHFDEDDIASSSSGSPTSAFEFRFRPRESSCSQSSRNLTGETESSGDTLATESSIADGEDYARRQISESDGWYSGSIGGLSALLNKPRRTEGSPVLRPQSMGNDGAEDLNLDTYMQRFSTHDA